MVCEEPDKFLVINRRCGKNTGETEYQTKDGRWWKLYDGTTKTGKDVRILIDI